MFSNAYVYPVLDYLLSHPLVEVAFTLADAILRNWAIIHIGVLGVDSTLGADKLVAKLVCGTLAGSGGGFWIGNNNKKKGKQHETKSIEKYEGTV